MSSPAATHFGVYHSHHKKGREILVTIALPEADGEALVEELGPIPTRYKKIAVAVGAVADTLADLLQPAAGKAPAAQVSDIDPGAAVADIARLVIEVDRLTIRLGSTLFHADRETLKEQQLALVHDLAAAQLALTAYFQAQVPGARAA